MIEDFPGWTTRFTPMFRKEQSRHASGRTRTKSLGTPIWHVEYQSRLLTPNEMDQWKARINAVLDVDGTFRAWPLSRCWPINHPYGLGAVNGVIASIGGSRRRITATWTAGATLLAVGDYVEINGQWLHQVTNKVSANVFDVMPTLSVGASSTQAINIHQPGVLMTIDPGSVDDRVGLNGRGQLSFSATEARG